MLALHGRKQLELEILEQVVTQILRWFIVILPIDSKSTFINSSGPSCRISFFSTLALSLMIEIEFVKPLATHKAKNRLYQNVVRMFSYILGHLLYVRWQRKMGMSSTLKRF